MYELERSPLRPINSAWANVLLVLVYVNRHEIKVALGSVALYAFNNNLDLIGRGCQYFASIY